MSGVSSDLRIGLSAQTVLNGEEPYHKPMCWLAVMGELTLHLVKEMKIVEQGEHVTVVTDVLDRVGATGHTIINNVSGKGHYRFHDGHLLFNDTSAKSSSLPLCRKSRSSRSSSAGRNAS